MDFFKKRILFFTFPLLILSLGGEGLLGGKGLLGGEGLLRAQAASTAPDSSTPESAPAEKAKEPLPDVYPFIFPYYIMKGVSYPISAVGHLIDRNRYTRKTVEFITNGKRSFSLYPILTVGDGSRFGGGLGITHIDLFDKQYQVRAQAIVFTDLDTRAQLEIGNRAAFHFKNRAFSFLVGAKWFMDSDEDFYGIGPNTKEFNKAEFSLKTLRAGASVGVELIPKLTFAPHVAFDWGDSGFRNIGGMPSVETVFPPSELNGFGEIISYVDLGFRLAHDTRDNLLNPETGGLRSLSFHHFHALNHERFNFFQWNYDIEQYFRLGRPRFVLGLHNAWTFQERTQGNEIPFYRLASLDVNSPLRGFDRGRFRDRGSVVFNVELRYPLWDIVDGTVFFDTGRVFDGIKHFTFKDFKFSGGGGLRVTVNKYYLFKLEVATGGEGVNVIFRAIQQL